MSRKVVLPAPVMEQLEILAEQLQLGEIGLQDLPSPVAAFFYLGETSAKVTAREKIESFEQECDRYYLAAFTPAQRDAEYRRRFIAVNEAEALDWEA